MVINRNCINSSIRYDGKSKEELCNDIDGWKKLLVETYGARKGDLVAISIMNVNSRHVSALFACAELGLRIILLDSPAKLESLPYTKLARFGPAKFCITDGTGEQLYDGLHGKMIQRYSECTIHALEMTPEPNYYNPGWYVLESDPFLVSSTSGTTDYSKKIEFTHEDCMVFAIRNINIFKFVPASVCWHTKNMHHASSMLTDLLPSMMISNTHYSYGLPDRKEWLPLTKEEAINFVETKKIDRCIVPNRDILNWLIRGHVFTKRLTINMSGFTMDNSYADLCGMHNLRFISHYGSIDTAIPALVNVVDEDYWEEDNCLGHVADTEFWVTVGNGVSLVHHTRWKNPRRLGDRLEYRNGKYYHLGRIEEKPLDVPQDLDLTPFYQDTKLNMDQLRGYMWEKYSKKI